MAFYSGFSAKKYVDLSILMLVYQRVPLMGLNHPFVEGNCRNRIEILISLAEASQLAVASPSNSLWFSDLDGKKFQW